MPAELLGLPALAVKCGPIVAQWLTRRAVLTAAQRIEASIGQSLFRAALAGYDHLRTAANAQTESVREGELRLARHRFSELCHIDPEQVFHQKWLWIFPAERISAVALICAGYHGSFCYFAMSDEPILALSCVYESAARHPLETLRYFPDIREFLSRDYASSLDELHTRVKEWKQNLNGVIGNTMEPNAATMAERYNIEIVKVEREIADLLGTLRNECLSRRKQLTADLNEATRGLKNLRNALRLDSP